MGNKLCFFINITRENTGDRMGLLLNDAGDHITIIQMDEALNSYFPMCSVQRTQY